MNEINCLNEESSSTFERLRSDERALNCER